MVNARDLAVRLDAIRTRWYARDRRNAEVTAVLRGNFDDVAPDLFDDEWPRPVVANRVKVFIQHAGAALAPLPMVSCSSVTAASDRSREFADKRTKIANHYLERSRVQAQMQRAAEQFYAYGLIVTSVEPDFDEKFPTIVFENPVGIYPVWDRLGRTREVFRVFRRNMVELCAEYPEHKAIIEKRLGAGGRSLDREIEVVKWVSADRIVMFSAEQPDVVFLDLPNPLGRCTYVVTPRPGWDEEASGAVDDLIWVQLALHAMQTFTLSAAAQSVNAPFAVPDDVTEIAIGPGEVVRSREPEKIRRVGLDVPQGAWAAQEYLKNELDFGAIVPEALSGSIDASVVTGKGVQQLMAGYSQQIAMAQESLVGHFHQVIQTAFAVDEAYWPSDSKAINGHSEGTPYRLTYRPERDIKGDHSVEVQYGGIAGLDPNRGLVFLLQALGAGLVSQDYVRRHLPSDMNPSEEESKIAVESMRDSLLQGLSALVQSIPQMVANQQDPSDIIAKAVQVTNALQKGEKLEAVLAKVFPPPEPDPQMEEMSPEEQQLMEAMGGAPGGGGPEGFGPSGLPPGIRPGLATRGPGARPDLAMMFAGLSSSGQPNLQAGVSRYIPT